MRRAATSAWRQLLMHQGNSYTGRRVDGWKQTIIGKPQIRRSPRNIEDFAASNLASRVWISAGERWTPETNCSATLLRAITSELYSLNFLWTVAAKFGTAGPWGAFCGRWRWIDSRVYAGNCREASHSLGRLARIFCRCWWWPATTGRIHRRSRIARSVDDAVVVGTWNDVGVDLGVLLAASVWMRAGVAEGGWWSGPSRFHRSRPT